MKSPHPYQLLMMFVSLEILPKIGTGALRVFHTYLTYETLQTFIEPLILLS
jgi:hypothetical protein